MSKFTGKADFYDTVFMSGKPDDFLNEKSTITMNGCVLKIDKVEDLYQYSPFLVASMSGTKVDDDHIYHVNLAKEPYWDSQERESLSFHVREVLSIWKKKKTGKDLYEYWVKNRIDAYYEGHVISKIIDVFSNFSDKEMKFLIVLADNKINPNLRNNILEVIVDTYLYDVHMIRYQKRRKEFVDWYEANNYPDSNIVQSIKFKLGCF